MIKLLDKETIDKIAAGEVIERPASVVKELLENSIDAGSGAITIEIKDGGCSLIRVTDNGMGIEKADVRLAVVSHATSKIDSSEDLMNIGSLGFRGEALATIAAVSETELITKTYDDLVGTKYVVKGGVDREFADVGVPSGTTVIVRDLFYNTPARKKFLKTAMTEGSYISDIVQRLSLSHPGIAFKLISNGRVMIDTSGSGSVKDTVYQLFGRDITQNLLPVSGESGEIKLSGFIGRPNVNRGNRSYENYFINERYIKNNIVNRAIEEGYRTFMMQHQFPFTVLYIELPSNRIDVNVHPTKMEFKYDNEKELFTVISNSIREALLNKDLIPKTKPSTEREINDEKRAEEARRIAAMNTGARPAEPFENKRTGEINESKNNYAIPHEPIRSAHKVSDSYKFLNALKEEEKQQDTGELEKLMKGEAATFTRSTPEAASLDMPEVRNETVQTMKAVEETETQQAIKSEQQENATKQPQLSSYDAKGRKVVMEQTTVFDEDFMTGEARKKHRVIGQVFGTYWLIEYEDNLFIMDQHAAHEKINYEAFVANLKEKKILSQQLLPPMIITVNYAEKQAVMDNFDLFMKLGYDIEEFGGNEFKINAVPSNLYDIHGKDMFMEFVGSLIENSGYMSNEVFIRKLASMACKAAIKGNTRISFEEAENLLDRLLTLENPYTCPHGRPTIISVSEKELEKKFKRIV